MSHPSSTDVGHSAIATKTCASYTGRTSKRQCIALQRLNFRLLAMAKGSAYEIEIRCREVRPRANGTMLRGTATFGVLQI